MDGVDLVDACEDAGFSGEGLRLYCEVCGCVRYFINRRVEGLDEIYTCSVCYTEKWFRIG